MEDREKFFRRLRDELTPEDLRRVELAYILAKDAHRPQRRQELGTDGEPMRYFEHPRRVAIMLFDEIGIIDADALCMALLHDIVEDTRYITIEHIRQFFGNRVADGIALLTKRPKYGYEGRLFGCSDWRALVVKSCDRLDNLRSLGACDAEKIQRKLTETEEKYFPIFDRMVQIAPKEMWGALEKHHRGIKQVFSELVEKHC